MSAADFAREIDRYSYRRSRPGRHAGAVRSGADGFAAGAAPREPSLPRKLERLAAMLELPRPSQSEEDAERFTHQDLPHLGDLELRREGALARLGLALAADDRELEWWCGRMSAISAEIRSRTRAEVADAA